MKLPQMLWFQRDKERERFYLLVVSAIVACILYFINRGR